MHTNVHVCIYVCMCVCMYVCMHVCIYMYVCTGIKVFVRKKEDALLTSS